MQSALIKKGCPLRIVFGLAERLGITDWKAAERLLKLSARHANVVVKKWNSGAFHPKLFIFHGNPSYLVVGSANLTGAAQSTNAEANLLVEDPDAELMRDAMEFFERHFTGAPRLERVHVQNYKLCSRRAVLPAGPKGSREDRLPSRPQSAGEFGGVSPDARVWKIAPGKDAKRWPGWEREIGEDGNGFVAMGWNEVGSLDDFATIDDLRIKVAETAKNVWNREWPRKTNEKYATDQLWAFRNGPGEGDLFIVYSECRVFGIAEVTPESEYRYRPNSEAGAHQITVRYRQRSKWPPRADKRDIATLGKQGTLMKVGEPSSLACLTSTLPKE